MSAPARPLAIGGSRGWLSTQPGRTLLLPLGLGLLLLGGIFHEEAAAAVRTWIASTAYNHCFLIIPIVLFLLWDRREELSGIQLRPAPAAMVLGVPLGLVWLAAERLGVMEGRQLVAVGFVELLLLALCGRRLWWAMSGPLLYLVFLVPFGEFLTPKLQDVTTFFIRQGLELLRVPAYIDGYVIEIPQGTFFVAEACAGLRFLIASIAFGCLYALMLYRSPLRRGIFILVSITVPIFANGLRGIGIVYLGYLLNSAQAAAADHIIYGWVFFSLVILMLIALGLPFRQDEPLTRRGERIAAGDMLLPMRLPRRLPGGVPGGPIVVALAVAIVGGIFPAIAALLSTATAAPVSVPGAIDVGPGCAVRPGAGEGQGVHTEHAVCGKLAIDLAWQAFSPRVTAGPVMAARRRLTHWALTESASEAWLSDPGTQGGAWRIMTSNDPIYVTAVSVWVDGKPVRPGMAMRARLAVSSLSGSAHAPVLVTVTPAVDWETMTPEGKASAAADLRAFLSGRPGLNSTVAAMSAVR